MGDVNGAAKTEKKRKSTKTVSSPNRPAPIARQQPTEPPSQQVDMEKLAEGLEKLGEDDLLHVVQMVHDNKSDDTYTKNDVESEYLSFLSLSSVHQTDIVPAHRR